MTRAQRERARSILLIVEDEILAATAIAEELEHAGYRVLELTCRHQEALLAARACKPNLALVNIQLEGGDDGVALACDLKEMGVPVVFISGQVSRAASARTVALGSLPKPFSPLDALAAVDYLLADVDGEVTPTRPERLELFGQRPGALPPNAAKVERALARHRSVGRELGAP